MIQWHYKALNLNILLGFNLNSYDYLAIISDTLGISSFFYSSSFSN